jgi:myosin heavy subunit
VITHRAALRVAPNSSYVTNPKAVADLCGLHNIHEPGILANLEERLNWPTPIAGGGGGIRRRQSLKGSGDAAGQGAQTRPYTYLSTVLVAVNPLRVLPDQPKYDDYQDKSFDPESPHPYAIAELAYQNLRVPRESEPASQSIVISGESGAGKTETAKIILSYLSNRGSSSSGASEVTSRIAQCILDSSPVFEAFGNAKTTRNNNSSRFGKFISMHFAPDQGYSLVGATVTTYLLEKMRVCVHTEGERNFHIFYDMLGADGKSKIMKAHKILGLSGITPKQLNYLADTVPQQSSSRARSRAAEDRENDEAPPDPSMTEPVLGQGQPEMLAKVLQSLEVIGVVATRRLDIFRVISGILHLGNAAVTEKDTVEGLKAHIADDDAKSSGGIAGKLSSLGCVGKAAELFGLDGPDGGRAALVELLTVKKIKVMREKNLTSIKLLGDEARFRRDAVSRALYGGIFAWLVDISNQHLMVTEADASAATRPYIGVLDIFGFESFPVNGLEQLLINFANEYLQNIFNKQVFEAELRLFEEENMDIHLDECPDNQPCVNLLAEPRLGILDMLNEQCAQIKPSEEKFVRDVSDRHKASIFFPKVHRKDQKDHFQVQHFAGVVKYRVDGWLLKNSDPLPEALAATFTAGKKALGVTMDIFGEKNLLQTSSGDDSGGGGGGRGGKRRTEKKPTVCLSFVTSMKALKAQLESTKCNFIRCIKPNALMKYGIFDRSYVVDQLRCLGILTTCEVLKAGMPTRITYKELKGTALAGLPEDTAKRFEGQPEEVLIAACMTAFDVPAAAYQLGRTRVFFKAGEIGRVETILKVSTGYSRLRQLYAYFAASESLLRSFAGFDCPLFCYASDRVV